MQNVFDKNALSALLPLVLKFLTTSICKIEALRSFYIYIYIYCQFIVLQCAMTKEDKMI